MKNIEKICKALANKKRLEILALLHKAKSASVGEVAEKICISLKATSKHLLQLYQADFVEKERRGGLTIYTLNDRMGGIIKKVFDVIAKHF